MSNAIFYYYLDASALIKLVVDEPGSKSIHNYYNSTPNACITLISFIESLGVLKRKWKGQWDKPDYHKAVEDLLIMIYGGKPEVDNMTLADPATFKNVSKMAKQYNLDFADALQLFAILKGKYSQFNLGSQTRFVSADKGLVKAARDQGVLTWLCTKNTDPKWV